MVTGPSRTLQPLLKVTIDPPKRQDSTGTVTVVCVARKRLERREEGREDDTDEMIVKEGGMEARFG